MINTPGSPLAVAKDFSNTLPPEFTVTVCGVGVPFGEICATPYAAFKSDTEIESK